MAAIERRAFWFYVTWLTIIVMLLVWFYYHLSTH